MHIWMGRTWRSSKGVRDVDVLLWLRTRRSSGGLLRNSPVTCERLGLLAVTASEAWVRWAVCQCDSGCTMVPWMDG